MVHIASALSVHPEAGIAASEAAQRVRRQLGQDAADLACIFISPHHAQDAEAVLAAVREHLAPANVVGCTGEWVVGDGREVEDQPAVSVWAASMPGAVVTSFHMQLVRVDDQAAITGFPDLSEPLPRVVIMVGEPFSFPADALLRQTSQALPGLPFVGGMASGGRAPGDHLLFSNDGIVREGAVGVTIGGQVHVRTLVSQGCRPIGRSYVVTRSEGNVIQELGGKPALVRLEETFEAADPRGRELLQEGLHVGIVVDEYKEHFDRGDFLVRNVMGADQETGAIAVGEVVAVGRTVQFHVRDADSADEDLRVLLEDMTERPAGALLFTCNGRGSRLFGRPDHDAGLVAQATGQSPVAGFFCNGEIGPVGPESFLHGFTASLAFFSDGSAG